MKSFYTSLFFTAIFFSLSNVALANATLDCSKFEDSAEHKLCLVDAYVEKLDLMNREAIAAKQRLSKGPKGMDQEILIERLEVAQEKWSDFKEAECALKAAYQNNATELEVSQDCQIDMIEKRTLELKKLGL